MNNSYCGGTVRIVSFVPEHYGRLRLRPEDAADLTGIQASTLISGWKNGNTLLLGDEPVMIFGSLMDEGVGLIWAVTSPLIARFSLLVTRLGRVHIQSLFDAGAHRVEAYCHKNNTRSLGWLTRSLGMSVEGLMRRSGSNAQDRYLLSALPDDWPYRESASRCRKVLKHQRPA